MLMEFSRSDGGQALDLLRHGLHVAVFAAQCNLRQGAPAPSPVARPDPTSWSSWIAATRMLALAVSFRWARRPSLARRSTGRCRSARRNYGLAPQRRAQAFSSQQSSTKMNTSRIASTVAAVPSVHVPRDITALWVPAPPIAGCLPLSRDLQFTQLAQFAK